MTAELMKACEAMVRLVEGFPAHEWRSNTGQRIKDTKEWVEFYVIFNNVLRDQRALASQQPAAQGADEIGWLVENGKDGSELRYRTWKDGLPAWTRDHNEATRYCRRIDAEKAHAEDVDGWRVVEHMWPSVPSRRPTGAAP